MASPFQSPLEKFTNDEVMMHVGGNKLVGEYQAHNMQANYIVEERIKILVRSMVKAIQWHHNRGYCVSKFTHCNFEITDTGRGRLIDVTVMEKTEELVKENYVNLRDVITHTVFRKFSLQQRVPSDWRLFLGLMREPIGKEYLICNHSVLLPIGNRYLFFMKSYEHVKFSLGRSSPEIEEEVYDFLPYQKNWMDLLQGNLLLEASYDHKSHDISGSPDGFFDYYRHTNAHRMDRCYLIEKIGGYSADDFERILVVRYPLFLAQLEEILHKKGQLQCLAPHTLF